ncbi:MAG: hypothetical protein DI535_26120 [Citrobacter freundii]|nr:MAG: hypothetical protein DI535_26120 [Citrobacter freundii]
MPSQQNTNNIITAVDIGGSHITVCLVDLHTQTVLNGSELRHHIDSSATAEEVIASWAAPIQEANNRAGLKPSRIGIAMPGPFDYEKGISLIKGLAKYEQLYGLNVKELLAEALSITAADIRMVNDATAYLIGEHQLGSGKGAASVLGITLGTGFGSAWHMHGQLTDGDLYKFPFRDGVAEDYVSTRWLLKAYAEQTGKPIESVKAMSEEARTGNEAAVDIFMQMGESLGQIILQRFSQQLPERVVIGGNIARSAELFVPAAEKVIQRTGSAIEMVSAVLGERAALIGAGCLWQ